MLLSLLLMVTLLIVAAAAIAPSIAHQMQRDREEELIHRGMQYRRAIRAFAKRTGTFPHRLDELENTNGTRFLRRKYKDPITGGEFRMLHMTDLHAPAAKLNPSAPDPNAIAPPSDATPPAPDAAANAGSGGTGLNPNSPAGQLAAIRALAESRPGDNVGPMILGVASKSTKTTIREFEHKNHYNQWLFFYSQTYDGSVEVKGPTPSSPIMPKPLADPAGQSGQAQ